MSTYQNIQQAAYKANMQLHELRFAFFPFGNVRVVVR
jgi:hypothetical protein